jgi:hypothetical protein
MKVTGNHPDNLTLLIDRDKADKRYDEIAAHIESCHECREEIQIIKSVDALFRSPEFEIEVPPFQWERIRERLEEHQPAMGWWEQVCEAVKPQRPAWTYALGILLAVVLSLSGLEYYSNIEARQFLAIATYSESERQRIESADNPFRGLLAAENENPFTRFQIPDDRTNPFAVH